MRLRRLFSGTLGLREVAATLFALSAGVPLLTVAAFWVRYRLLDNPDAQLGLLLVVLLSVLGFVLLWRVADRIAKLADAVIRREVNGSALAELGSSMVPGVGRVTELGQMTHAFSRLLEDLGESTERLEDVAVKVGALDEMAELAVRIPSMRDLLAVVLERTMQVVRATIGSVMLLDAERQTLRIAVARGLPDEILGVEIQSGDGIAGTVAALGGPVLVDDIEKDPRFGRPNDPQYGSGSFICMPVRAREKVIGVINLARKEDGSRQAGQRFSATDLQFLNTLMIHIGYAIDNARLFDEAQQSTKQLQKALEDLKATQAQLIQGETLRATGQLASGTAHHLNNLLAVIVGRVQLLQAKIHEPELRQTLEIVQSSAQESADVVRRMQVLRRGPRVSNPVSVDLNGLVGDVVKLTRPLWQHEAQLRGIQIEMCRELGEIPLVTGDRGSLREVLWNLLLNAIDALPEGGTITVRTWTSDGRVHCSVADTGVGMSDEVRCHAFEPFFTTKGPKRTGLGLSVTHAILQRHDGDLTIESANGAGTTVTVHLPGMSPPSAEAETHPEMGTPLAPLRILLIDDDVKVRETLAEMLAADGHMVLHAARGQEGVARLEAGDQVDLVLTDLGMPGITGWDVVRAVKAHWPGLPIGVVTGWSASEEAMREQPSDVDFIIPKPVTFDALQKEIARCLRNRGLRPGRRSS